MRNFVVTIFVFVVFALSAWAQSNITTIEGMGATYANGKIEVFGIDDYISMHETKIAEGKVGADSLFKISFYNNKTQKVRVKLNKNYFYMYIQPNGNYDVLVGSKNPYHGVRPEGTEVEFIFGGLDKTDINFNILDYEIRELNFLKKHYRRVDHSATDFVSMLDTFKLKVQNEYKNDTSKYLKDYVRYGLANLDNLTFLGNRNRYEKYDFYLKPYTVNYDNDMYMSYFNSYYADYDEKLGAKTNQEFYEGVLNASPTMIMKKLGKDYALKNLRVREVVMIKMLGDVFYSQDYPQTNILTVLDSVSNHALFERNKVIAKNLKKRLIELVPGSKAPNYIINFDGDKLSRTDFLKKYHYIQFVTPEIPLSMSEVILMKKLNEKYGASITITTIIECDEEFDLKKFKKKNKIDWNIATTNSNSSLIKQFGIGSYPEYVLIDKHGYIVASPALGPKPNGDLKTIENMMFSINRNK